MLTEEQALTQRKLAVHYAQLEELKRQAAWATTRERQEEIQRHWDGVQAAAEKGEQEAREQADRRQAEEEARQRKFADAEAQRQSDWAQERDRLTFELAEARTVVSVVQAGDTDQLSAEVAERLRLKVWLMAAELLVQDAEEALASHHAAAGYRTIGRAG